MDNHAALAGKFKRTYRFNDAMTGVDDVTPSMSELPALAIFPAQAIPTWYVTRIQRWPYALDFGIWTPHWNLKTPERLWEDIVEGLWQYTADGDTVPYVKLNLGYWPQIGGGISHVRMKIGERVKAIRTTFTIVFPLNFSPFAS